MMCVCFFLFFVMLIIALCSWNCVGCSTTNDMFSLRHLVWLIGGSNKILKPEQKKLRSNETCRLLVAFHFLSFQKGMIFESESKKGLKSIFFIHRLYCVPQLSNWFIWTMNVWKRMPTQEWHQICANILIAEDYWVCLWNHWNFNRKKHFFFFRHVLTLFGIAFYGLLDFAYTIQPNIAISSLILPKLLEIHSFSNPSI